MYCISFTFFTSWCKKQRQLKCLLLFVLYVQYWKFSADKQCRLASILLYTQYNINQFC